MPTRLTIPERQQFGTGLFESHAAFQGYAALRWSWPAAFTPTWRDIDIGLGGAQGVGLPGLGGGLVVPTNLFTLAGQNAFTNITKGMTHTQHAPAAEYVQRAFVLNGIGQSIERIAADVLDTKKDTARKTRPRTIIRWIKPNVKAQLRPYAKRTAEAEARAEAAEKKAAALEKRVAHLERMTLKPSAGIVVGLPPRVGLGEREREQIKAGLRKVSKYGTLAFFLALLAKALEKMGSSFIRCSNMKRYGRGICGMNPGILGTLLADALMIAGVVSLVQFAAALVHVQEGITKTVLEGFKELRGVEPMDFPGYTGGLRDFSGYTGTLG